MVTQMLCFLCGELKTISCWVRHGSGNVGCQWNVNIFQFEKTICSTLQIDTVHSFVCCDKASEV